MLRRCLEGRNTPLRRVRPLCVHPICQYLNGKSLLRTLVHRDGDSLGSAIEGAELTGSEKLGLGSQSSAEPLGVLVHGFFTRFSTMQTLPQNPLAEPQRRILERRREPGPFFRGPVLLLTDCNSRSLDGDR